LSGERWRRSPTPGLVLLLAVAGISSASILVRLSEAPPLSIAFFRLAYAAVLHVVICLATRQRLGDLRADTLVYSIVAGLCLAAHFGLWITSLAYTTVAASTVLVTFHPMFTAVGAHFFLKEPIGPGTLLAMTVGVGGTVVIAFGGGIGAGRALLGDGLALAGAVAMSAYLLFGRRVRRTVGTLPYATIVYTVAAAGIALASVIGEVPIAGHGPREHLLFFGLAVIPTLCGHTLLNWALAHVRATGVSIAVLGEPVAATILAWLILREIPHGHQIIGGGIVLFALTMHLSRIRRATEKGGAVQ